MGTTLFTKPGEASTAPLGPAYRFCDIDDGIERLYTGNLPAREDSLAGMPYVEGVYGD
jgi:hypothetical protein